jgi:hypothetical protein
MRRVELTEAVVTGWTRLDATRRDRFFHAFLRAALRLNAAEAAAAAPLAEPIDPARFAISDADIALLMKNLPLRVDDADGEKIIP